MRVHGKSRATNHQPHGIGWHLLSAGRIRIGHITGPDTYVSARLRASAAQKVLREAGLPVAGGSAIFGQ